MNKDTESLFKSAKTLSLTATEKSRILREILDISPTGEPVQNVRKEDTSRLYEIGRVSPFAHYYSRFKLTRVRAVASMAAVLVLLGITGVNAQGALPGDFLYPMKINVNEKLAYIGAHTLEAQALLEATFATRRLEEAHELLYENKLTVRASEQLAVGFSAYSEKFAQHIDDLVESGETQEAEAMNIKFASSLTAHREVLGVLVASSSVSGRLLRSIEMNVKASAATSVKDPSVPQSIPTPLLPEQNTGGFKLRFPDETTDNHTIRATGTLEAIETPSSTLNGDTPNIQVTSSNTLKVNAGSTTQSLPQSAQGKLDLLLDF